MSPTFEAKLVDMYLDSHGFPLHFNVFDLKTEYVDLIGVVIESICFGIRTCRMLQEPQLECDTVTAGLRSGNMGY